MEFKNGSIVRGFTAGTRSKQEAGAARGHHANFLCFAPGTLVNTTEFAVYPIEELTLQHPVTGGDANEIIEGEVLGLYKRAGKIISIVTPLNCLNLTEDHPVFDGEQDVPAKDANNLVVSLAHQNLSFKVDAILARLMGYNFGGGSISLDGTIAYFYGSAIDLEQIAEDIVYLGGERCTGKDRGSINEELKIVGTCATIGSRYAGRLIGDKCPKGRKVYQPLRIPESIKNGSIVAQRNFLSGLFSAEGSKVSFKASGSTTSAIELRMTSSREEWIENWACDVAELLEAQDVVVKQVKIRRVKKVINKKQEPRWSCTIRLANSKENTWKFVNNIGCVYSVEKRQRLNKWKLFQWYMKHWSSDPWKKNRWIKTFDRNISSGQLSLQLNISKSTIKHHRESYHFLFSEPRLGIEELSCKLQIINENYVKLPILKNVPPSKRESVVYNLTSSAKHRFFGNGALTHNCFDEADFLSPQDIDAALAVIMNFPDASVWMSSTPTGRREKFFETCSNKQYREFHYPSNINPNWTDELEAYFRSELTHDGYTHEIEAEFGEQEEGVYQLKYVEAAQADWEYKDMKPNPAWTYMIGVDWNDVKIGTTIAVIGFNPQDNTFYLVDKYVISRADRTQLASCQKIAETNRLWNASCIYVDSGYGSVQLEILHDYGARCLSTHGPNHPDSRLRNIVKGYDFGSTVEIRDPFTKQPVKKPAKPFLVENSVRRFENVQFQYPKSDQNFTDQLLGYIVDRVSIAGRPVYKAQNEKAGDHFLDAVNLAFVAFALEKSQLGHPTYSPHLAIAGKFGDNSRIEGVSYVNEAQKHRPSVKRAAFAQENAKIFPSEYGELPAWNTSHETNVGVWRWDEFSRDGPKPQTRSLRQAFREAEYRVLGSRNVWNRPARKKF
jgi:replicative DNA helicase